MTLPPMNPTTPTRSLPARVQGPVDARHHSPTDALRCAVPVHLGGLGGSADALSPLILALHEVSPSAAWEFWAQRMAIEFLVQADNVALREFLLPDLLTFHKPATVPFHCEHNPLRVSNDGRHFFLSGGNYVVANAQAEGFTLICPVRTDEGSVAWCVVDSELGGFERQHFDTAKWGAGTAATRITLQNVFFRGDELLGEADLAHKTREVQRALGIIFRDQPVPGAPATVC